jgi:hypothetical protein
LLQSPKTIALGITSLYYARIRYPSCIAAYGTIGNNYHYRFP